jgi:hypothetical protein
VSETIACRETGRCKDRAGWGPGPWDNEPDRVEFRHAGLACLLHRGGGGAWCGYVGLPPGHPAHGKGYGDALLYGVSAHGGLTYAAPCAHHVCHVPKPGEPDDLWWLGFDCAHAMDRLPGHLESGFVGLGGGDHYWTVEDVTRETKALAEQLAAMGEEARRAAHDPRQ